MQRAAVLNVVGLTEALIGPHTPRIAEFARSGKLARVQPAFPAVTCTAQSNYLTGTTPAQHGIVGNGWYDRALSEVHFWKQSNRLVAGAKVWEDLRREFSGFTCANLFWWYNMYSGADYSITPRPMYPADGRKFFDIYSWPYSIREEIKPELGEFPFATFWGPAAGRSSPQGGPDAASRWIANASLWIEKRFRPSLSLIYLPHLDYNLQRFGAFQTPTPDRPDTHRINPQIIADLEAIDEIVGGLLREFQKAGVEIVLLSEYGITNVNRPVHLNRLFRGQGWLVTKEELGRELLDYGASKAFAVADHQVAHVYVNDQSISPSVYEFLKKTTGVASVLSSVEQQASGVNHARAGDLIAVAEDNAWFTYYYWLENDRAPDFARTVDIHRKPGYDPVELFIDPAIRSPKLKIAGRLFQKQLGFRMLMDVIPLDATLVGGSHGKTPSNPKDFPVFISQDSGSAGTMQIQSTEVYAAIKNLFRKT